ncbi:MAG: ATP-binding cassette domain-containing protein [Acidimicrobiia bacterium]|nr:ATP-binding cassette domain-containing protein [Acidimicrobiia bacterium]
MIEAEGLEKRFGETEALAGLGLSVPEGQVLGLLGPNGAGKTTAVRILTTLLKPDAGRAFIDGVDVLAEPARVRARIGVTGQYAAVDEGLTGRENLEIVGRFNHLGRAASARRADELLERFALTDAADRVVKGFSGGMRRRIDIAMSLVARPRILFLDEPTTGLDPRSRIAMWDLIGELKGKGMTTLLTTQYLDEADHLSDDIMVIDHGRSIAQGTATELKEQIGGARAVVTLPDVTTNGAADEHDERSVVAAIGDLAKASALPYRDGSTVSIAVHATVTTPDVVRRLDAAGVEVADVAVSRPTLDDVFLTLTGRSADADAADGGAVNQLEGVN